MSTANARHLAAVPSVTDDADTAATPSQKPESKKHTPTARQIALLEAERARVANGLSSEARVRFIVASRKTPDDQQGQQMVDRLYLPVPPNADRDLCRLVQQAINALRPKMDLPAQNGAVTPEPEAEVPETAVIPPSILEDLVVRQAAVWAAFAQDRRYPFPYELMKPPATDLTVDGLQRYALLLQAAETILQLNVLFETADLSVLDHLPTPERHMIVSDAAWLFRLDDDLPRLQRELAIFGEGIVLLQGSPS